MLKFFHRLRISQKLMLISIVFMIPDSVLLTLFLLSINENIRFAQWEQYGNEYQRPLEDLLNYLPEHRWLADREMSDGNSRTELVRIQAKIDHALTQLEAVDARFKTKLQFTDEGLAKRQREHFQVSNVKAEWERLKIHLGDLKASERASQHTHLIADVRTMITHVGDTSNLILDPDLDSYYLMDVTLLALPQIQDRIAAVLTYGESAFKNRVLSEPERRQLAVDAALLQQADLDRVVASTRTALNEDPNFYGRSESFQTRVPPALANFLHAAEQFIYLTVQMSESAEIGIQPEAFRTAGTKARETSFALWKIADEELDGLLSKRINYYRGRRARSLILTGLALVAAVFFVAFITRSISNPLRRQAAELRKSNESLMEEVQERERIEVALRSAEEKYRSIFENAVEGIFQTTPDGHYLVANPTLARMHGYESVTELQAGMTDIATDLYVDPQRRVEFQRLIHQRGQVEGFESQVRHKNGNVIWISEHARAVRDSSGNLLYYEGTVQDITERKNSEAELEALHKKLVDASRQAGMAEVATGVLHNVGNVLNSVNVSANFVTETLRKSRLVNLSKVVALLREHAADLGEFLTNNQQGKQIPSYLDELAGHLVEEQEGLLKRLDLLRHHLEHIKEIVAMQQNYAKASGVTESISVTDLVEDALHLNAGALNRHNVEVCRQYDIKTSINVDKHKVLQILVNLISNAKFACAGSEQTQKRVTLHVSNGEGTVKIAVSDNGVGIPPENLIRIFSHGFTTRKDGHGFGLHSGALAAKEIGGALKVTSAGVGQGATFTLEIPLQPAGSSHA